MGFSMAQRWLLWEVCASLLINKVAHTARLIAMRAINAVILISSAANLAYAHPELQKIASDTDTDAATTPCPFAEILNGDGLDDIASNEENSQQADEQPSPLVLKGSSRSKTLSTMELSRNNAPVKKKRVSAATTRGRKLKKKSSSGTPNIYLPSGVTNANQGRIQDQKKKSSSGTPNIYFPNGVTSTNQGRNQDQNGGGGARSKQPKNPSRNQNTSSEGRNFRSGMCFTTAMYDDIDFDIWTIQNGITDLRQRGKFLGGLLRLAAHDAMDFSPGADNRMGADGCYDPNHPNNAGLELVWSDQSALKQLYMQKYRHISRADFWIACANAVIRQTSIGQQLDMKNTFRWGRQDSDFCIGQADRLPLTSGCSQTENVFLNRMKMSWEDAVALMGAHTLGHGDRGDSGHQGTWVSSNSEATVFDKGYYVEIFRNNWRMSGQGNTQDWTTGTYPDNRLMLNTDICLAYNIDSGSPCCTKGNNIDCMRCSRYAFDSPRKAAEEAVLKMLGGPPGNTNNDPFYASFQVAWNKMTTVGQNNLIPLSTECWV